MKTQYHRTWLDFWICIALGGLALLIASVAHAEPDYGQLCEAIKTAEGNSNYGVLTHYHHTSYRQACINTCRHAYKDWLNVRPRGSNTKSTNPKMSYLTFLQKRYAPVGAKNDPKNLNKNWLKNVRHYKEDI